MQSGGETKAYQFIKEFRFYITSLDALRAIIEKQGYTIVEFNALYNAEHIDSLIKSLNLEKQIQQSRGFTYADSNCRLVFINESLTEEEKLTVLAHEEGHIYCKHLSKAPIIGEDVLDEREANEFSHYILHQTGMQRIKGFAFRHKKVVIVASFIMVTMIIGTIAVMISNKERSYYGNYYITETGSKYHIEGCSYIKDKTNIHRMTVEEYESGKYEPCDRCLPDMSQDSIDADDE